MAAFNRKRIRRRVDGASSWLKFAVVLTTFGLIFLQSFGSCSIAEAVDENNDNNDKIELERKVREIWQQQEEEEALMPNNKPASMPASIEEDRDVAHHKKSILKGSRRKLNHAAILVDDEQEPMDIPDAVLSPDFNKQQPSPPNKEQMEEPVIDGNTLLLQTETNEPGFTKQTIPAPPNEQQEEDAFVDSNNNSPAAVVKDDDSLIKNDDANEEVLQQQRQTDTQDDSSSHHLSSEEQSTESSQHDNTDESSPSDANGQQNTVVNAMGDSDNNTRTANDHHEEHHYCTAVWGRGSHRPADLDILHKLFRDVVLGEGRNLDDNKKDPQLEAANAAGEIFKHSSLDLKDEVVEEFKKADKPNEESLTSDGDSSSSSSSTQTTTNNEFVAGLDDIDKLFEGIDAPDELDVGLDGSSIQEVLMGSGTKIIINRITKCARFVQTKFVAVKNHIVHRMQNENGEFTPFQRLRNEQGEFTPFHRFRNEDGEFAVLQRFKNEDGEFTVLQHFKNEEGDWRLPSKQQIAGVAKRIKTIGVKVYRKGREFVDNMLEGEDVEVEYDDLDFSFMSQPKKDDQG